MVKTIGAACESYTKDVPTGAARVTSDSSAAGDDMLSVMVTTQ